MEEEPNNEACVLLSVSSFCDRNRERGKKNRIGKTKTNIDGWYAWFVLAPPSAYERRELDHGVHVGHVFFTKGEECRRLAVERE